MLKRKLNGNDVFKVSKMLKKMDLKLNAEEMQNFVTTEQDQDKNINELQMVAGFELFKRMFENLHLVQEDVNDFLGGLCGCSGEEFGEKDLDEVANVIVEVKDMVKDSNFLKHLSKLM